MFSIKSIAAAAAVGDDLGHHRVVVGRHGDAFGHAGIVVAELDAAGPGALGVHETEDVGAEKHVPVMEDLPASACQARGSSLAELAISPSTSVMAPSSSRSRVRTSRWTFRSQPPHAP